MNDTAWHERLADLADRDDATTFDVERDLVRGRARLRQRRVAEVGSGLLAVVVLVGGALMLNGGPGPSRATPGPAATDAPTFQEPQTTLAPSPTPTARHDTTRLQKILDRSFTSTSPTSPFPAWRRGIFEITRSVLDPQGGRLDYSTDSFHGGGDGHGGFDLGIKMGWTQPGESGQGMVQLQVNTQKESDQEACSLTAGFGCPRTVRVGGATMRVGTSGSAYVVLHRQPDGDRIVVLVDALFGNNTVTPVSRLGFSKADVYRLVQDERLGLPSS